jgi:hypothetical protein
MDKKSTSSKVHSDNIDGYIHKVSDIRHPASGHRYFEFKVQEWMRIIESYASARRSEMSWLQNRKTKIELP